MADGRSQRRTSLVLPIVLITVGAMADSANVLAFDSGICGPRKDVGCDAREAKSGRHGTVGRRFSGSDVWRAGVRSGACGSFLAWARLYTRSPFFRRLAAVL